MRSDFVVVVVVVDVVVVVVVVEIVIVDHVIVHAVGRIGVIWWSVDVMPNAHSSDPNTRCLY